MSIGLDKALKLGESGGFETIFSGPSQLTTDFEVSVKSVPSNFFDVVYTDFYVAKTEQDVEGIEKLDSGDLDPIALLYSNSSLSEYPTTEPDFNNKNAYLTTFKANWIEPYVAQLGTDATYTCIIPSALANQFAIQSGDIIKLMQSI